MPRLHPRQVQRELERVLEHGGAEHWITRGLAFVTPDRLSQAVSQNADLVALFSNHFHLSHPVINPLARLAFRVFWNDIDRLLSRVQNVYDALTRNPWNKRLLDTPEGRRYLNEQVRRFAYWIWTFAWA